MRGGALLDNGRTADVEHMPLPGLPEIHSAFAALVYVPKETLTIEGTTKTFTSPGGSGKPMLRYFCPECGSTIAQEPGTRPELVVVHVGTLDDPKSVTPAREIFCDDALPWVQTIGDMRKFARRPV